MDHEIIYIKEDRNENKTRLAISITLTCLSICLFVWSIISLMNGYIMIGRDSAALKIAINTLQNGSGTVAFEVNNLNLILERLFDDIIMTLINSIYPILFGTITFSIANLIRK